MQNQSYAGAAGGIGGALWAMLDASLTPGIYAMLKAINFEARIADADIVVTGEGAMDSLTLLGKAPYGVCGEAAWNGIRRLHSWEACQTATVSMSTDSCRFIQRFPALCRSKRR